ncbi:MAG: PEPxxWA-CTERM sorting domain-containing protein [Alphaproteobacteria bacterium]
MLKYRSAAIGVLLALGTLAPAVATAATAVSAIVGGSLGESSQTRGFKFSLSDTITVTGLGYYDAGGDGFAVAHEVGIWDLGGNLLVSGTVSSGTSDTLVDGFRYTTKLSGLATLAAGSYLVGGRSNSADENLRDATSATFGPLLSYGGSVTNGSNAFSAPTVATPGFDVGYFGANFTYDVGAIPEPGTWALMIGGFGLAGAMLRRRRAVIA